MGGGAFVDINSPCYSKIIVEGSKKQGCGGVCGDKVTGPDSRLISQKKREGEKEGKEVVQGEKEGN